MPKRSTSRLTDMVVKTAKPSDRRYEIYDADQPGFGLRVATSGTKSWIVLGRVNGRVTRATLGRYPVLSLSEARKRARAVLLEMAEGDYATRARSRLFEDVLAEWYLRDQGSNRSLPQVQSAMTNHVVPFFRGRSIDSIRRADVIRLVDTIADHAPTQANRVLAFTRRFFNWCLERDILDVSPAAGVKGPSREASRDRVLNRNELAAILGACDRLGYPFGPLVELLILTGQRLKEVAEAQWAEFDLPARTWTIPAARAKNATPHIVHLSNASMAVLNALPRANSHDWLFSTTGERPVSGFSKAKARLDEVSGVSDWRLHDLRRTFATMSTETLQFPPAVVDRVLNHVSGSVKGIAAVYQKGEYIDARREVLIAWSGHVEGIRRSERPIKDKNHT